MAYLDLDDIFAPARGSRVVAAAEAPPIDHFSPLEWSVIALAKRDSLRSLVQPGRVARAMGGLFGPGTASTLADPRLEALRRLAVYAWHRGFALPESEIERFHAAGFSEAQIEAMVTSITGLRVGMRERRAA